MTSPNSGHDEQLGLSAPDSTDDFREYGQHGDSSDHSDRKVWVALIQVDDAAPDDQEDERLQGQEVFARSARFIIIGWARR